MTAETGKIRRRCRAARRARGVAARRRSRRRSALPQGARARIDDARAWTLLGIALRHRDPAGPRPRCVARWSAIRALSTRIFISAIFCASKGNGRRPIRAYETRPGARAGPSDLLNNLALALDRAGDGPARSTRGATCYVSIPSTGRPLGNLSICSAASASTMKRCPPVRRVTSAAWPTSMPASGSTMGFASTACRRPGAEASFRRALALAPDDALILTNLGSAPGRRGDFEDAEPLVSRGARARPASRLRGGAARSCRAHLCAWSARETLYARISSAFRVTTGRGSTILRRRCRCPMSPAAQLRVARRWADPLLPPPGAGAVTRPRAARARESRLRLGYVSSDFRTHAIAFLLTEVWERHDRDAFETYAYSIGPREDSPLRSRIEAAFDTSPIAATRRSDETARRIRDDGIDMLIDLNGYTTHARSEIFALRPAPVQWPGSAISARWAPWYRLHDHRPLRHARKQPFFTERFLRPSALLLSQRHRGARSRRARCRARPAACRRGLRLLLLQRAVQDPAGGVRRLDAAARARSRAACCGSRPAAQARAPICAREARRRGVDGERLVFAPRVPPAEHLARHAHADLFLDTLPYNAGTTANDALFMGFRC